MRGQIPRAFSAFVISVVSVVLLCFNIIYLYLCDAPHSHLLTDCDDTPRICASASWVISFSFRYFRSLSARYNSIRFLSCIRLFRKHIFSAFIIPYPPVPVNNRMFAGFPTMGGVVLRTTEYPCRTMMPRSASCSYGQ